MRSPLLKKFIVFSLFFALLFVEFFGFVGRIGAVGSGWVTSVFDFSVAEAEGFDIVGTAVAEAGDFEIISVAEAASVEAAGFDIAEAGDFEIVDVADAEGNQRSVYDLVVLVVDKDVMDDGGLQNSVERYAEDLREAYAFTDVKFLLFDSAKDDVLALSEALENIYVNGAGKHLNKMKGVVLIGDVPLPVVSKASNRFVSLLPYTDFVDKAYLYDADSDSFLRNPSVALIDPEIWHGVIKAESNDELMAFFDKNHAYYEGDEEFADFDRKLFFGDLINAEEQVNDAIYQNYLNYLDSAEDVAYMRYNKHWAKELSDSSTADLAALTEGLDSEAKDSGFFENDSFGVLPDIYSKGIIDQYLMPYYKVFPKYLSSVNDWVDYTGRYDLSDVDTTVSLISVKDEYNRTYLKEINNVLEKRVNELAYLIEEPLPVLESSVLSVDVNGFNNDFRLNLNRYDILSPIVDPVRIAERALHDLLPFEDIDLVVNEHEIKYNYKNDIDGKFYINGVNSEDISSAKLCSVYLGSTKSEYFDEESKLFNPRAVDGEFSVLTRSMRSDNISTFALKPSSGVNTAAYDDGVISGFVIQPNSDYGISAFSHNPLIDKDDKYVGAFEENFEEGDIIVSINAHDLGPMYTFDRAIEEAYRNSENLIHAVNDADFDKLKSIEGNLALFGDALVFGDNRLEILESSAEIVNDQRLRSGSVRTVVSYLDIEYYRDSLRKNERLSFSVTEDDDLVFPSNEDARGRAKAGKTALEILIFPKSMGAFPAGFSWEAESDAAIFSLYSNESGYDGEFYGPDAGCNANSTQYNSDRCLAKFASIPVLDPAGSLAAVTVLDGDSFSLEFPFNSSISDIDNSVDLFKFPDDYGYYDLEDIDKFYLDSCFANPMLSYSYEGEDSNFYDFVLDPFDDEPDVDLFPNDEALWIVEDFYGHVLRSVGDFVDSDEADDADYDDDDGVQEGSSFDPSEDIWKGMNDLDAEDFMLNKFPVIVTLKNFSDHYGLFDGIDNDGDGLVDMEMKDLNGDGNLQPFYDFDEANPIYGIPSWNLAEISRKMLSHENSFLIPFSLAAFPDEFRDGFNQDIRLNVRINQVDDQVISSVILHNEPTPHTIMQQLKAGMANDLPIDNPRYVAFQVEGGDGEGDGGDGEGAASYSVIGDPVRIDYINVFGDDISSFDDLTDAMIAKSREIAALRGSYKVFGPEANAEDYTENEIALKILSDYFAPSVTGFVDVPESGFDLEKLDTDKVVDALRWKSFDIDSKHEYVLNYYLNAEEDYDAFVSDSSAGYEASYLVLDGQEDFFTLAFNREREDGDDRFDPIKQIEQRIANENVDENDASAEDDADFDYVWLQDFPEEIQRFIDSITPDPQFVDLGVPDWFEDTSELPEPGETAKIVVSSDNFTLLANNQSKTTLHIELQDADGNLAFDDYSQILIFANSSLRLDAEDDVDPSILGSQIMTSSGRADIDVYAKDIAGAADLIFVLLDYDLQEDYFANGEDWSNVDFTQYVTASTIIDVLESVDLKFELMDSEFNVLDGNDVNLQSILRIATSVEGPDGVIENYNGKIEFNILNDDLAEFVTELPNKMVSGSLDAANVNLFTYQKSGLLEIEVNLPGLVKKILEIDIVPNDAVAIELGSNSDVLDSNEDESIFLQARIVDEFGNLIQSDTGRRVEFSASDASADMLMFQPDSALSLNGIATTTVNALGKSGAVNLIASSEGLEDGIFSISSEKIVELDTISKFAPRSLYVSLLGGNFGDEIVRENIAQTLLHNGQAQAVSALTSSVNAAKRMFFVDAHGELEIVSDSVNASVILPSENFPYQRVLLNDSLEGEDLASLFIVPNADSEVFLNEDWDEDSVNGIYFNVLGDEGDFTVVKLEDGIYVKNADETLVRLDNFARIFMEGASFALRLPEKGEVDSHHYFTLVLTMGGSAFASISWKQDFRSGIKTLSYNSTLDNFFPGIYVQSGSNNDRYDFSSSFSGISTNNDLGLYLVDNENELDFNQRPNISDNFGFGFEGDNKHMLLFSAGNSVGDSNLPYVSEASIIYGDPNVRVEVANDLISLASGYSSDIGKPLYNGDQNIQELISFDFNADDAEDVLIVYEDGRVNLLENTVSNDHFLDRGELLNIYGSALSLARIDFNNDGFDDLIAGTLESCHADDECLSLFVNNGSGFSRESLNLDLGGNKVNSLKAKDLNLDGCEDLVISDSSGKISIYYNQISEARCVGLELDASNAWDFGYKLDQNVNLMENLFVSYEGMNSVENKMIELASETFIHLPADVNLSQGSGKIAVDLNADTVAIGDEIQYTIRLQNNSDQDIVNLRLSDATPLSMTLLNESLKCLDVNCPDDLKFKESGISMRSAFIEGISIPANGFRVLQYSMEVNQMPQTEFEFSKNDDLWPDILIKPNSIIGNKLIYLNSRSLDEDGHVVYNLDEKEIEIDNNQESHLPEGIENYNGEMNADMQQYASDVMYQNSADSDGDGIPNMWDDVLAGDGADVAEEIANGIGNVISALRCSGGCLPIIYNKAFLFPDDQTPGLAALAGVPSAPFVRPAISTEPSTWRFYVGPTLTMNVGTALCIGSAAPPGQMPTAPCYAFAVPNPVTAACERAMDELENALVGASDSMMNSDIGMSAIINNGEQATDADGVSLNLGDPSDPISANVSANIKIPGFPSVLTDWMDNQTDELYNKLMDFPKFYLILPDIPAFVMDNINAGKKVQFQSFNNFATSVASIPLIQIEGKEVVLKIPAISNTEIEKYRVQWMRWKKDMQQQLNDRLAVWNCDENAERRTICDQITADIGNLTSSINDMMDMLDQIANMPRDILNFRNLEAKYAAQIVAYLDTVTSYIGGYIKKQSKIIESWMKAVRDAIRTVKDWRVIMDLMVEYQSSCDKCKSDRFSKLGLLMNFFAVIPEPPIISIPKWPDLVIDLSNMQMGTKIIWPDVVFRPEPIKLPDLPHIVLPEVLPDIHFELPGFEVPDWPTFILPDLPDLPPLALPQLPDLPKPPRVPPLPKPVLDLAVNLKPIFKIVCLLKNGLIPVPEYGLSTEIETLTQPSINIVLPIIAKLGMQWPAIEYTFVREIRVHVDSRFYLETDAIFELVDAGVKKWNKGVKKIVSNVNKITQAPYGQVLTRAFDAAAKKARDAMQKAMDDAVEDVSGDEEARVDFEELIGLVEGDREFGDLDSLDDDALDFGVQFADAMEEFDREMRIYIDENADDYVYPEEYLLVADSEILSLDDAIFDRNLAEIEYSIAMQDLPDDPSVQYLADLRDVMLAYAHGLEDSNDMLSSVSDPKEFSTLVAQEDPSLNLLASISPVFDISIDESESSMIAANDLDFMSASNNELEFSLFGEDLEEEFLLAYDGIPPYEPSADLLDAAQNAQVAPPIGFYVMSDDGVSESVLDYKAELKQKMHVIFDDVDDDSDVDIIFSMGADVYLKENYKLFDDRLLRSGSVIDSDMEIENYLSETGGAINNYRSSGDSNSAVNLSWDASNGLVSGYEILISDSLDFVDSADYLESFIFSLDDLSDPDKPRVSVDIPNGNYYSLVYALDSDGKRSIASNHIVLSPSICSDKTPPFPVVTSSSFDVSIYHVQEIDASNSFDSNGEIVSYYLESVPFINFEGLITTDLSQFIWNDLDDEFDSDGDGVKDNDRNDPIFSLGPFENEGDVGVHDFILHIVDQSGNESMQSLSLNVFVPDISLDQTFARTHVASGATSPASSNIPFSLMRNRFIYRVLDGELKLVPRLDVVRNAVTDSEGQYQVSDFNDEPIIIVENADGNVVAEINSESGNIGALADGYEVIVRAAVLPDQSTSIDIVDSNGNVLASVALVADANSDVVIVDDPLFYDSFSAVHLKDLDREDEFKLQGIPANDPKNPGGALLLDKSDSSILVSFDTSGNIVVLNDERVDLRKKGNNYLEDELVIEILVDDVVRVEFYILSDSNAQFMDEKNLPVATPRAPSAFAVYGGSQLVEGAYLDILNDFENDDFVSREEFIKILLDMLCIIPRDPEAYEDYANGKGYNDIEFDKNDLDFYYPYIKEATLLGLVEGYGDEELFDEKDIPPFRPDAVITRAEAVKVILEALEMQGVIELPDFNENIEPWHAEYIEIAQNLSPYLTDEYNGVNNFIITSNEAKYADAGMSFDELLMMVRRVLQINSCSEIDDDDDGMSDFCELKYGVEDPNADDDGDGISNIQECLYGLDPSEPDDADDDGDGLPNRLEILIYGTDPYNPDTDGGGVWDIDEIADLTDPLDDRDDGDSVDASSGEEGVYINPAECNTCPCLSTLLPKTDIMSGDVFFPIISVDYEENDEEPARTFIFTKGNEVLID